MLSGFWGLMMTKTLEELQAEVVSAQDAAREAVAAFRLNSSGLAGHVVEIKRRLTTQRFLVERVKSGGWIEGRIVRKNGTLSTLNGCAYASNVIDLGPFVAGMVFP